MNDLQGTALALIPPSLEQVARFAVWRSDLYICTGIAYAKSLGKNAEDFTAFVGRTHNWEEFRGQGLRPPVQLLHFLIKTYRDGEFEILSEAEEVVSMRFNRPYAQFFEDGILLGVSLEEFEACLWGHIAIMASLIGLEFVYHIEGNLITASLSKGV